MRKNIVLVAALAAGVTFGSLFYLSGALGFAVSKYLGGKRDGEASRLKSILVPWRQHHIHLHHWLISAMLQVAAAAKGFFLFQPELFYGFLSGVLLQGIYCYTDWHRIIKKRPLAGLCPVEEPLSPEASRFR